MGRDAGIDHNEKFIADGRAEVGKTCLPAASTRHQIGDHQWVRVMELKLQLKHSDINYMALCSNQ